METGSRCVPEKSNCVESLIEMILVLLHKSFSLGVEEKVFLSRWQVC